MEAASLLRTPLPVEAARSLIHEGLGTLAMARVAAYVIGPMRGAFHEEDRMTTTVFWVMALPAMTCAIWTMNMRQHCARVPQHRGRR